MAQTIPPEFLEAAYRKGLFPMADEAGIIHWYSPDPRTIIDLACFHLPRSLARTIRQEKFQIVINRDFERIMWSCANRPETWINGEIVAAYTRLHHLGKAHSVEAYYKGEQVGGLYGVSLDGAFMAESMFTAVRDASKVCLAFLVSRLQEKGFQLLDVQFLTTHLSRFGATEISRADYMRRLKAALKLDCRFD